VDAQVTAAKSARAPVRVAGRARDVELLLLMFAAVLLMVAWVLVDATQRQPLTLAGVYLGVVFFGLLAGAHALVRWRAPHADPLILPCVGLLNGLGLVMIHRLDLAAQAGSFGSGAAAADVGRQLAWTAVGVGGFVATLWRLRRYQWLARYGYTFGLVGLVLLVLPGLLPASVSQVNGAKLWLRLGPASIQPGEFAKILIIVFVAAFLVTKRELFVTAGRRILGVGFPRARDLAPLLIGWGLSVGVLTLERELGASLLIFGVVLGMIYVATARVSWVLLGLVFFTAAAVTAYYLFAHVRIRVQVWENPFADPSGTGYQVVQALLGLGTGGVGGTGLGGGRPELVPLSNADFIIASLGEELGLFGLAAVLVVYLMLVTRGLRAALDVRDSFGKLLAVGLSLTIGWQVFIVVGGVTNLIPDTGLATPFLSYGGSSLVANYLLAALLILISHTGRAPNQARPPPPRTPLARAATEVVKHS
jgi:cell division protein FtsW (lipid II flippase)